MGRPQRFPVKLEFWTNETQLEGLEFLCSDGLTDKPTHLRQALQMYLRHFGFNPPPRPAAPMNGAAAAEHA
jgi:hypothetical protein